MWQKLLFKVYALLWVFACLLAWYDFNYVSIGVRWLSLILVCIFSFKGQKNLAILFSIATFFSGIGETYIVLGYENYPQHIMMPFFVYYWMMFYMVKKSSVKLNYRIFKDNFLSFALSVCLVLYLVLSILKIVKGELGESKLMVYLYAINFCSVILYMGLMCMARRTFRFFWLLLLIICFVIATPLVGLEALYYPSKILQQVIYIAEIASHFFLLKFLITKDEDVGNKFI